MMFKITFYNFDEWSKRCKIVYKKNYLFSHHIPSVKFYSKSNLRKTNCEKKKKKKKRRKVLIGPTAVGVPARSRTIGRLIRDLTRRLPRRRFFPNRRTTTVRDRATADFRSGRRRKTESVTAKFNIANRLGRRGRCNRWHSDGTAGGRSDRRPESNMYYGHL